MEIEIQFIINNEERVFLEFKRADIVKSELKFLTVFSYQTTTDPPQFWYIQPKRIPAGFFSIFNVYFGEHNQIMSPNHDSIDIKV